MSLLELVAVFSLAVLLDGLNTLYVRSVAEKAVLRASVVSGLATLLASLLFVRIVSHAANDQATSVCAYALGSSAGTWLGLRRA